jgi:hypothetical protein
MLDIYFVDYLYLGSLAWLQKECRALRLPNLLYEIRT